MAQLQGVGRIRARNLYQKGYKNFNDLKFASVEELSKVNQIGKTLAKDILEQVTKPIRKKRAFLVESTNVTGPRI